MTSQFIQNPQYAVYETQYTTYDPLKGLKLLGHPAAHYDNYADMLADWTTEFLAGTHNFFVMEGQ